MRTIALAVLLCACGSTSPVPPIFTPPAFKAAVAAVVAPPSRGGIRDLHKLGECCRHNGPNPIRLGPKTEPRVGTTVVIRWVLDFVGPGRPIVLPNGDTRAPNVALVVGSGELQPPIGLEQTPGCFLFARPDAVFTPLRTGWLRYDERRQVVTFEWTPAPGMEGSVFYLQLLVEAPGANELGLITSQGLELRIGSAF